MKKLLIVFLLVSFCTPEVSPETELRILQAEVCEEDVIALNDLIRKANNLSNYERNTIYKGELRREYPLSIFAYATVVETMFDNPQCYLSGQDDIDLLHFYIEDFILSGGNCDELARWLNKVYIETCDDTPYPTKFGLPLRFVNGEVIDIKEVLDELDNNGNLVLFNLKSQNIVDEKQRESQEKLDALNNPTTTSSSSTSTTSTTTTSTTSTTTTSTSSTTTTSTTIRDNPPYWENNTVELIELTYSARNCFAYGKFQFSDIYDERPVTLFFDTPGINVRLSERSGDLTKNDRGWTIVVPIGGPPGPEVSIYAIDDAGQYSEYLKFKVPDNAYECPYDN